MTSLQKKIKQFANYISVPLCDIINSSIKQGIWPEIYKTEAITPIPKKYPANEVKNLHPISILFTFDKIMESLIGELLIQDMSYSSDKSQYGNKKHVSINDYLLRIMMIRARKIKRKKLDKRPEKMPDRYLPWKVHRMFKTKRKLVI